MLSVWWSVRGVEYWELLPDNTTVTAEVYCAQLDKLKVKIGVVKGKKLYDKRASIKERDLKRELQRGL